MKTSLVVVSRKYGGGFHRSWTYDVVESHAQHIVLWAPSGRTAVTAQSGAQRLSLAALTWLWFDRWFNVVCLFDPCNKELAGYYCHIATPAAWRDGRLEFTDLDLDLVVTPGGSWEVEDEQDYLQNARRYAYSRRVKDRVRRALLELRDMIEAGSPPFGPETLRQYRACIDALNWSEHRPGQQEDAGVGPDAAWWAANHLLERPNVLPEWAGGKERT